MISASFSKDSAKAPGQAEQPTPAMNADTAGPLGGKDNICNHLPMHARITETSEFFPQMAADGLR
jgi:hypothetical protein